MRLRIAFATLLFAVAGLVPGAPGSAFADPGPEPEPPAEGGEPGPPVYSFGRPQAGRTWVHLDTSDEHVQLERETGDKSEPFSVACVAPCDTYVRTTGQYRIAGDGVRPSRPFALSAEAPRVALHVEPAWSSGFKGGIVLAALGGPTTGLGLLWVFAASYADDPSDAARGRIVGLGVAALGAFAIAGGVRLIVGNARTRVRASRDSAVPLRDEGGPESEAEERSRDRQRLLGAPAAAKTWAAPVFSVSF